MTSLQESLNSSLKEALRSRDEQRKAVLRGALAALKQAEIDGQQELREQAHQIDLQNGHFFEGGLGRAHQKARHRRRQAQRAQRTVQKLPTRRINQVMRQ
ncbi:MAG: GatB/YqeY domain-containing protein [Planctomycetes bacterium]|nr:GatB/YqeY domain-containing protein [Planctomycetota bacterium]